MYIYLFSNLQKYACAHMVTSTLVELQLVKVEKYKATSQYFNAELYL